MYVYTHTCICDKECLRPYECFRLLTLKRFSVVFLQCFASLYLSIHPFTLASSIKNLFEAYVLYLDKPLIILSKNY